MRALSDDRHLASSPGFKCKQYAIRVANAPRVKGHSSGCSGL
jgi:hypothetical protein